jgi:hypothetical protein
MKSNRRAELIAAFGVPVVGAVVYIFMLIRRLLDDRASRRRFHSGFWRSAWPHSRQWRLAVPEATTTIMIPAGFA